MKDEEIYNIARNYVIGLHQKITYEDWLPEFLGKQAYGEIIGDYKGYDSSVNPNIENEFATAAYRVGHSLLVDKFPQVNKDWDIIEEFRLTDMFGNPHFYES